MVTISSTRMEDILIIISPFEQVILHTHHYENRFNQKWEDN